MNLQRYILVVQEPWDNPRILMAHQHDEVGPQFFLISMDDRKEFNEHWRDLFLLDIVTPEDLDSLKRSIIKKLNLHPETDFSVRNFSLFVNESP